MLKKFLIIILLSPLCMPKSHAQWSLTTSPAGIGHYVSQFRYSSNSPQYIWWIDELRNAGMSIDGGTNFDKFTLPPNFICYDIIPLHSDSAFLLLRSDTNAMFKLYKTFNGGLNILPDNFINDTSNVKYGPKMVLFFDNLNGVVISDSSDKNGCVTIYSTSDAGETWKKNPCNTIDITSKGSFTWSNFKKTVNGDNAIIRNPSSLLTIFYSTNDKGKTWHQYEAPFKSSPNFAFKDSMNGILQMPISRNGKSAVTSDGGKTWDTTNAVILPEYENEIIHIKDQGKGVYIVGGNNGAYYSSNEGKEWNDLGDLLTFKTIAFYDNKIGIGSFPKTSGGDGLRIYEGIPLNLNKIKQDPDLLIWPNPCPNFIFISQNIENEINIYDLTGKLVLICDQDESGKVDLTGLSNGFYILNIRTGVSSFNYKILKN